MKDGINILPSGATAWSMNDKFHREDGPAVEYLSGTTCWYLNGLRHREDGPAIEWNNGYNEWFIHGEKVDCMTNEEFLRIVKLKVFL